MTWMEAIEALLEGKKVKMPEWKGCWKLINGDVIFICEDKLYSEPLHIKDLKWMKSNLWMVVDA